MALSDRRAVVTCGVSSVMNGASNPIIFMYQMVYDHHFSHSIIHITTIATELMHDLRRKKIHYDFPCFVASFISLFILVGFGSQLLAPRWVKASYRWSEYDSGLGGEEFGSG